MGGLIENLYFLRLTFNLLMCNTKFIVYTNRGENGKVSGSVSVFCFASFFLFLLRYSDHILKQVLCRAKFGWFTCILLFPTFFKNLNN